MASSSKLIDDLNIELSLAPPNVQVGAPPNPIFPNSSFHHGSASNFAEAMPKRVVLPGGITVSRLTPADHLHVAQRSDKAAVEESHDLTVLHATSSTNLGIRLLARTRECAVLTEEVASLKAQVADLQKRLYCANQQVEALWKRNNDHAELLQILQIRENRGN